MPRSCYVENCSNNAKSQPNLNCYILSSDKQRRWMRIISWTQQRPYFLRVCTLSYLTNCIQREFISAVLWQHPIKYTFNIYPNVFKRIIHKFKTFLAMVIPAFFSHLNLPTKTNQNRCMPFEQPDIILPSPETIQRQMNPEVNIKFTQFQTSSVRTKLPQARFLLITTSKISHCFLQLQIIKSS